MPPIATYFWEIVTGYVPLTTDSGGPMMVDSPMSGNWMVYLMGAGLTFFLIRNLNRIEKLLAQHSVEIRSVQDEQLKQKILHSDEYISGTAKKMSDIVLENLRRYNTVMPAQRPEKQ